MSLAFANAGDVVITSVRAEEKLKKHLGNLGLMIGSRLRVLASGSDMIVSVRGTRLALNRALAMKIQVEECV